MTIPTYLPTGLVFVGSILAACGILLGDRERARSERKLAASSEEITELNKKLVASVTGGDSYCYLRLFRRFENDNCGLTLVQVGAYPVYDVTVSIVDLSLRTGLAGGYENYELMQSPGTQVVRPGNVAPGQELDLEPLQLYFDKKYSGYLPGNMDTDRHDFDVTIISRNGLVSQKFRFRVRKGIGWMVATRLEHNGKIEEDVPQDFPLQPGETLWSSK